jgi:16S rRNA (cytosine967-C5)-methyltransferase
MNDNSDEGATETSSTAICQTKKKKKKSSSIWSMPTWNDGWFEVQDAGSQMIVEAAEVQAGDVIVDYCAGNGGKTLALASQLYLQQQQQQQQQQEISKADNSNDSNKSGCVIAHDIVEERLRQLKGSLERAGLSSKTSTTTTPNDITPTTRRPLVKTTLLLEEDENARVVLCQEMANVVLVDAPCSSVGVLRRRPSQRFQLTHHDIFYHFPSLQLSILQEASQLVKRGEEGGGRLIYATCSICPSENEQVVDQFERQIVDFDQKWQRWNFPENEENHLNDQFDTNTLEDSNRTIYDSRRSRHRRPHCRTVLPTAHGSDGFFMARWKRR